MAGCLLGKVEATLIHSVYTSMLALLLSSDLFREREQKASTVSEKYPGK